LAVIGAAAAIASLVSGDDQSGAYAQTTGTALGLAFLSLPAAAGAHLVGRGRVLSGIGYLTVAAAVVALGILVVFVWVSNGYVTARDWKPLVYSLLFAFLAGIVAVLLASASERDDLAVHAARGTAVLAMVFLVVAAMIEVAAPSYDFDPRVLSTAAVLFMLGTASLALLSLTRERPYLADGAAEPIRPQ
jgi:hypothetical protein